MPRQHLTPNACLVCRKKRTKCDGEIPCRRCRSRGEDCSYEDKKWRTKDHLRSEIERLRTEQRRGHAVIQALVDNNHEQWESILDRMRAEEHPDSIADWIRSLATFEGGASPRPVHRILPESCGPPNPHYRQFPTSFRGPMPGMTPVSVGELQVAPMQDFADGLSNPGTKLRIDTSYHHPNLGQLGITFERHSRGSFSSDILPLPDSPFPFRRPSGMFQHLPVFATDGAASSSCPHQDMTPFGCAAIFCVGDDPGLRTWTKITSDAQLVQRLFSRFFSGLFPTLCLVSQPHFIQDFRDGNPRYCSEALVNAILGAACRLFSATSQPISRVTFGDAFVGEAKRLLAEEHSHVNLPSIQALGVLAFAEMSQGNDEEAEALLRESVRASVHLVLGTQQQDGDDNEDFRAVRALACCGVFSLMRFLRLLTGDLESKTGPLFIRLHPDTGVMGEDTPQARVERGIALQSQFFADLRYCPILPRFVFEVTEVAHTFLSYNYSRAMTAGELETAYDRFISYYNHLSEAFPPPLNNSPDLLFAQIWYHFCMLSLLRPFVTTSASLVDGITPKLSNEATPLLVCQQAAEAIISLTSKYQSRHSLAYLPPLLPYIVFTAVLYQLTLFSNNPGSGQYQQNLTESPTVVSPRQPEASPLAQHSRVLQCASEPSSTTSTSFSGSDHGRRPSACSLMSGTTLDRDETSSSDTGSDMLPVFSSQPADLVTIGLLQLASMGAQHAGAAEAARLLRSLGPIGDVLGLKLNLNSLTAALPVFAGGFCPSVMMTGLGLLRTSEADVTSGMVGVARCEVTRPVPITPKIEDGLAVGQEDLKPAITPAPTKKMGVPPVVYT
ncbi:putative conidial development protein fluffy [Podospora fimiseda]|uniref:Conidial development protein fluffy n=1 Tax=Podospora fimiseda TaxID=252190 RepID=A0AAN6YPY1_9PEZI|nr:putative conidial development protein fluffy [Podospora fimiseda]